MVYSSSLSDGEWEILEPLSPEILTHKRHTPKLKSNQREILDGILYPLNNGCHWQDLPKDLAPDSTQEKRFGTTIIIMDSLLAKKYPQCSIRLQQLDCASR